MIGVVGLIAAIPFIEPRRSNLAMSRTAYVALWAVLLFYFLVLHVILVINALHEAGVVAFNLDVGRLVPISVGVLFVVIGNYLGKIRSNYMMGIRTPWTLASDLAWDKTHRLGG
ncbi:MAG: SdpI family protein, partial [Anaerolineales bacterium]|nr:SdpI family protein [Anaerolineales bacterium]